MRSDGAQSTAPFDVNDVQGDVVPGFKTAHRRFLVVKIDEPHAARHALSELADRVTKCSDIQKFRDQDQQAEAKAGPWLNVALSRKGRERLEIAEFGTPQQKQSFENGIEHATGPIQGRLPADESHMLFSIAADDPRVLDEAGDKVVAGLGRQGMTVTAQYDGSTIISDGHTHEHFGFRDGIAQPGIEGIADRQQGGLRRRTDTVPADRFVIGAGADGAEAGLDHHGSYMVFAKIEQFVDRFEEFCAESALRINADWGRDDVTPEAAAALMIGRYRDGTRVDLRTFPKKPEVVGGDLNGFTYDDDPYGRVCPLGAHVRKMNPRTNKIGDAHRILRRGMPYESEGEKGLLFVCYQASLAAGFEYLQGRWANGLISSAETSLDRSLNARVARGENPRDFNYDEAVRNARALPIDAPPDPLVGLRSREGTASFELPRSDGRGGSTGLPLFNDWVRYRTGDYFFTPSLSTLRQWGGG
jgi:Dyp-type peroxidase family